MSVWGLWILLNCEKLFDSLYMQHIHSYIVCNNLLQMPYIVKICPVCWNKALLPGQLQISHPVFYWNIKHDKWKILYVLTTVVTDKNWIIVNWWTGIFILLLYSNVYFHSCMFSSYPKKSCQQSISMQVPIHRDHQINGDSVVCLMLFIKLNWHLTRVTVTYYLVSGATFAL